MLNKTLQSTKFISTVCHVINVTASDFTTLQHYSDPRTFLSKEDNISNIKTYRVRIILWETIALFTTVSKHMVTEREPTF